MEETLRNYFDELKEEVRLEMQDHTLKQRAIFYGRLADWAYQRQQKVLQVLIP